MKYLGWVFSVILAALLIYSCGYICMYRSELEYKEKTIAALKKENILLEEKAHDFDWLKEELTAIDNYISVIDQLKYQSKDIKYPELERTRDELNKERLEVIENAVYWDRVLNPREVEK